jgi:hypothetical protein
MRPAVLHLCDLGVGIVRMRPSSFEPFFLGFRSSRAKSARVGVPMSDALRERGQKLVIAHCSTLPLERCIRHPATERLAA